MPAPKLNDAVIADVTRATEHGLAAGQSPRAPLRKRSRGDKKQKFPFMEAFCAGPGMDKAVTRLVGSTGLGRSEIMCRCPAAGLPIVERRLRPLM